MCFGEPHPFPERRSPTRLSASGQRSYEGWSCRTWNRSLICITITLAYRPRHSSTWYCSVLCITITLAYRPRHSNTWNRSLLCIIITLAYRPRHSNTWNRSLLCIIITLAYRLYSFLLLINLKKEYPTLWMPLSTPLLPNTTAVRLSRKQQQNNEKSLLRDQRGGWRQSHIAADLAILLTV